MKFRSLIKWISRIISGVLVVLLISVALIVLTTKLSGGEPEVFGYQIKTVLSGSMEPGIKTGSIIAVQSVTNDEKNQFSKGDVITFLEENSTLITHRITEVNETNGGVFYTTKGDNNNAEDRNPVLAENIVGLYSGFTIPLVGYAANFLQSPNGIILFLIVPGFLMLSYSIFNIWRVLSRVEKEIKPGRAEESG
ncbi:signal peptidase I SipW [Oceanobacillus sp. FSL H7-0719]|uniref:signal peptidase I SipW n=1 Tax=Oceanobacillus sp. FSL H7-0719 TaxID=2954507 RepID=UPI00324B3019